jgi:hypothetical protein
VGFIVNGIFQRTDNLRCCILSLWVVWISSFHVQIMFDSLVPVCIHKVCHPSLCCNLFCYAFL